MSDISDKHPFVQFLILCACILSGVVLVSLLTMLSMLALGMPLTAFDSVDETFYEHLNGLKFIQIISQLSIFVFPALLYAYLQNPKGMRYLGMFPKTTAKQWFGGGMLTVLVILCSFPFISWLGKMNMEMQLPDFLAGLETWMKQSEDQLAEMTEAFLKMDNFGDLLINLIVMAVTPAIAEEMLFRGALQKSLYKVVKNPHIAIIVTGIIFSAIHLQFYGFFPRMVIGIYLGYLFYWSKNLWFPILGHFINNGFLVVAVYMGVLDASEANGMPEDEILFMTAMGSLLLLTLTAFMFRKQFRQTEIN